MPADRSQLRDVVERFREVNIVVVGDLILDRYVWGRVTRISPEAPVVVVQVTDENIRLGGAGNVANNLAELGAKVSVCGFVGDDASGRSLIGLLDKRGIDSSGVLIDRSRPTTEKTRVIAHGQQVVRVDREEAGPAEQTYCEGLATALQTKLKGARGVIISDYAKGAICQAVFDRIKVGYEQGVFGFGAVPVVVDPKQPNFPLYRQATVIKPNRREAEEASGLAIKSRADAVEAGRVLLDKWKCEMVLITLGELGMVLVSGVSGEEASVEIETVAREIFDVSGAGDTVSAVFTLALAVGASPRAAATLSNFAAGVVVGEVGTAAVSREQLITEIEKFGG